MSITKGHIASLTGIRGLAALWVMVFHGYPMVAEAFGLRPREQVSVLHSGYLAVDLFFVLSGYVLAMTYAGRRSDQPARWLRNFALGRIFRIFPLNAVMLFVLLGAVLVLPGFRTTAEEPTLWSFLAALFMVQSWGIANPTDWNVPAWSLSTELAAYMLFPVMVAVLAIVRSRLLRAAAFASALLLLVGIMIRFGESSLDHTWLLGIPRCLCQFSAGVLLWTFVADGTLRPDRARWLFRVGSAIFAVVLIWPALQLAAPLAFCGLVAACGLRAPVCERLFGNRPVTFLGDISFSVYMTHNVILTLFGHVARDAGFFAAGATVKLLGFVLLAVGILVVSTLTWRFVELPGQALGKRLRASPYSR